MKKLLHKSCQWLLMLVAMFAVSATAMADSVTFGISDFNLSPKSKTKGVVTVSSTTQFLYYGSDFDITAANVPVTFSVADGYYLTSVTVSHGGGGLKEPTTGTLDGDKWTSSNTTTSAVTMYTTSNTYNEFYSFTVEYSKAEGGETPDPGTGGETPDPGTGGGTVTPDPGTGGGTVSGNTITFVFDKNTTFPVTQGSVTVSGKQGNDLTTDYPGLLLINHFMLGNFTATFSAAGEAKIVKIEFEHLAGNSGTPSASVGSMSGDTWTGPASSVTFSGNMAPLVFSKAVVTLEGTAPDPGTGGETPDPEVTKPNFPVEGVAYQLQVADENLYLNLQNHTTAAAVLGNKAEAIYFTWDETNKGFTIKDADGNFAGVSSATGWNMGSTTPDYWTVEQDGNAYYLKNTTGKYLGCNNYEVGNAFFRDKAKSDADKFVITEYVEQQIEYTYFTIPEAAFVKDHDTTYDENHKEVPTNFYFRVKANDVPGLDRFKYEPNGKQVTARLTADGATPRDTKLTIYGSYDGSQASIKSFSLDLEEKAFSITFPQGAFEADNGDVSGEFTYTYTPGVVRKTYTINLYDGYDAATPVAAPADVYVVYANAPEGAQYKNGSSYTTNGDASIDDFACPLKYWEIDREHSRVGESTIFLYLNRLPYTYHVTIEGCENATVTVKGEKYGNGAEFTSTDLLTDEDVVFDNNVRGYNLVKQNYTAPAGDEDGYITAVYDELQYTYAKLNTGRTNPAPGSYSLDDRDYGFQYFSVYFEETMSEDVSIAKADLAAAGITLHDAEGRDIEFGDNGVNAWADDVYFNFSAKEAITTPGTYTLHVPAGTFFFGETVTNPELNLVWTLTAAQYYTVQSDGVKALGDRMDPENEGSSLKNLRGFEITAPEGVTFQSVDGVKLYLAPERGGMMGEETDAADLTEATGYSISFGTTQQTILVSFDPVLAPAGYTSYSYIIPAGSIAANDGLTNKQISLSASVDPTVYFDLVVTYPAEGNAQAPVDHITVELPEGLEVESVDRTNIYFNGPNATVDSYTQNGRELTITFADHAAQAGDYASYSIPSGAIIATDITAPAAVRMANSSVQQYNIPVTAAPVEYLIEFAGLEGVALPASPTVTYNGQSYNDQQHIIATGLTVEQLSATDADGYGYVITIDQPGYVESHHFGRILVTYTAKAYAAVSSVSPAQGEISLDDAEGLGSITIFMDGEAGWDENVYCGGGNPVPAGVSMVGPNGAIELPWEGSAYGFCMWAGSNQINVNFGGTLKTPGQYTLIIPAGLNTIGGKENPRMEYTWTVKEATTFEFDHYYVQAIGDRNNDGVQLSLTGFTVALPENLSDCSTEVPGSVDLYITVSTGDEMSEEPAEPTLVSSTYSITDGVVTFIFPKAYTEKGRVSVTLNANNISINGLSNKAFSTSFYVDPNPAQYFSFTNADDLDIYVPVAQISTFAVTANTDVWTTVVPQLNAEMFADKTVTISYWDGVEQHMVNNEVAIADVETGISVATFKFAEPAAVPFGTSFDVIFPEGFITIGNLVSEQVRVNNNKLTAMFQYNVVYDVETVPADAKLYNYNGEAAFEDGSVVGQLEDPMTEADFTATVILGKKPVFTIVQPTAEQPIGSVTFSYEDNRIFMAPEDVIDFECTENEAGDYTSISKIYINAPEDRTYETIDLSKFSYYVGEDLVAYPEDGISYELNEEQDVVTITLEPAYSTVGTFSWVILDGGLVLDGGTVYAGANSGIVIVPPYDYATVSRVSPAESTIALEDEYDGLRYITINFKEKITEDFTAFSAEQLPDGFSFTDPDGKEITLEYLTGWADSDKIGITTKSLQRTLGEYKLHIPEGIFTFEGGKKNPVLDYTWTVTAPSTFAIGYYDVEADGQVKSDGQLKTLNGFFITAPEGVTFASVAADAKVIIPGEYDYMNDTRTEDEEVEGATITLREDGTIYVGFEPAYAPAEYTSYSFVIPAGAITAEDGRTSKEIRLSAGVDPVSYFDLATATEKETTSKTNTFNTYTITSDDNAWANNTGLLTADSFKGEVEVEYWANGEKNLQSQPVAGFTVNADYSLTLKFAKDFTVPFGAYYTVKLPAGFIAFPGLALTSKEANFSNHVILEKSNLEGVELSTYVATDTQEGITAACSSYDNSRGANIYDSANGAEGAYPWGIIKVNSDKTILKVELTVNENASSVMEKDAQGEFSVSGNVATWTGSSHALVFSSTADIYVSKLVVYYDADEVIVTENTVTLAESDTNGGQVGYVNKYINLTFAENFSVTHNAADYPEGVKFVRVDTPSEEPVAITNFAYFAGSPTLTVTLAESVTAGGTYKLVIPEGILPFGNLKSNVETIVTWTISADDISLDGKEDVEDVIAISDIILQTTNAERYDASKADLNGDDKVTIGDLVNYIEKLKAQAIPVSPEETDELSD